MVRRRFRHQLHMIGESMGSVCAAAPTFEMNVFQPTAATTYSRERHVSRMFKKLTAIVCYVAH